MRLSLLRFTRCDSSCARANVCREDEATWPIETVTLMHEILINTLSARSGGAVSYVRNLIPRLCQVCQTNDRVHMSILCDDHHRELLKPFECTSDDLIVVPTSNLSRLARVLWEKRNLPRLVTQHDVDVLFTCYQVITATTQARDIIMVRNMEPFLATSYSYGFKGRLRNYVLRRASAASVRSAHRIVAVSDFVRHYLESSLGIDPSQIARIYHGRDTFFEFEKNCGYSKSVQQPVFLTCGSLLPYRRCEDVIDAFAIVAKRFPELRPTLNIAGDGTEFQYRRILAQRAVDSGVSAQIRFLGHVPKDRMRDLFQSCQLCVLATEIEACPNTAIEALTSGCAIIASNTDPLPEILGDSAVYYHPRNIEKLAEHMVQFLEEPDRANEYRKKAKNRAACFDWDTCAQMTFDLLASS